MSPLETCNRLIDDYKDDLIVRLRLLLCLVVPDMTSTQLKMVTEAVIRPRISTSSNLYAIRRVMFCALIDCSSSRQCKSVAPAPGVMFGRDAELAGLTRTLLDSATPRIVILGAGGMGKTTLALNVMHAAQVVEKYSSRLFVSCEACTSMEQLTSELAVVLEIPAERRNSHLFDAVLDRLRTPTPTLVCLDNYETAWYESNPKRSMEAFLRHLDSIPNLSILITMRGAERPTGLTWSLPLFPPLEPLTRHVMMQVTDEAACHQVELKDQYLTLLMQDIDGLPLAASLLGHLLRDGNETPQSLWRRWRQERTRVIETDQNDRLYSLDRSINISLESRVMRACPAASDILSILATLPDGFPNSDVLKDELNCHLPDDVDLHSALITLRKVALIHVDKTTNRIRLLPPIRQFCLSNLPSKVGNLRALDTFYISLLLKHSKRKSACNRPIIIPERANLESVLSRAVQDTPGDAVFAAVTQYTWWAIHMGIFSKSLASSALACTTRGDLRGDMLYLCGLLSDYRDEKAEAMTALHEAARLYTISKSMSRHGRAKAWLGEIYLKDGQVEAAERLLLEALNLLQRSQSTFQARVLRSLAKVWLDRGMFEEAEEVLGTALQYHRDVQNHFEQGHDIYVLADLRLRQNLFPEAEKRFRESISLYRSGLCVFGEANALQSLGCLLIQTKRLDDAEDLLLDALRLHRQFQSTRGVLKDIEALCKVYMASDRSEKAEEYLEVLVTTSRLPEVA